MENGKTALAPLPSEDLRELWPVVFVARRESARKSQDSRTSAGVTGGSSRRPRIENAFYECDHNRGIVERIRVHPVKVEAVTGGGEPLGAPTDVTGIAARVDETSASSFTTAWHQLTKSSPSRTCFIVCHRAMRSSPGISRPRHSASIVSYES